MTNKVLEVEPLISAYLYALTLVQVPNRITPIASLVSGYLRLFRVTCINIWFQNEIDED